MKSKFKKILSILLTVALMLSCVVISGVSASATTKEYWVINGGTGDGRTVDTPAASVGAVIESINYDSPTNAIVYIKQRSDYNYQVNQGYHYMTYWAESGAEEIPEHTASITVKPYDTSITTYLVFSSLLGKNQQLRLGGPTTFEGLTLVSPRKTETQIASRGFNLTFASDVKFAIYDSFSQPAASDTATQFSVKSKTALAVQTAKYDGTNEVPEDYNLVVNNAFVTGSDGAENLTSIIIGGHTSKFTYKKDLNVTLNNAGILAGVFMGSSHVNGTYTTTVEGNINFNIKNASKVVLQANKNPLVANAFQAIISAGSFSGDIEALGNVTLTKGAYYLYNQTNDADLLTFTDVAGEYAVKSGEIVVAVDGDGNQTFSEDGVLKLPAAGTYEFSKYEAPKTEEFYVQYGASASNDGLSPEKPVPTVADAVKLVNAAGLDGNDTAQIFIMQSEYRDLNKGAKADGTEYTIGTSGDLTHGYTMWSENGEVDAYKAKLIVQPYTDAATSRTYLTFSQYFNASLNLTLNGPTEFRNLGLLSTRSVWNKVVVNGNSVKFGEGTTIGCLNYSTTTGVGTVAESKGDMDIYLGAYGGTPTYSSDVDVVFENDRGYSSSGRTVNLGTYAGTETYNGNYTITYDYTDTSVIAPLLLDSGHQNNYTQTFKNLNFHVKSANTLKIATTTSATNYKNIVVNGGLQLIYVNGANIVDGSDAAFDVKNFAHLTVNGGTWYIKNATSQKDMLSYTSTAGIYKVLSGYEVKATDADGNEYLSSNGVLKIPAGKYTVVEYEPPVTAKYYVKNGGTGDGRSESTPAASLEAVIASINEDLTNPEDTATVYIMQRDDWNIQTNAIHNMTYCTQVSSGTDVLTPYIAKLTITAYDPTITTYLCNSDTLGQNWDLVLGGDTVFDDITLVSPRYVETSIVANGYNVEFTSNAKHVVYSSYSKPTNTEAETYSLHSGYDTPRVQTDRYNGTFTHDEDVNLVFNNVRSSGAPIVIGGHYPTSTYEKDINIVLNNSAIDTELKIGLGHATAGTMTINGSINLNVKNATEVTLASNNRTISANAFQAIVTNGTLTNTLADVTTLTLTDNQAYYLYNKTGNVNLLTFTNTVGTYNVAEGWEAVATNDADGSVKLSSDGVLKLTAGSWTITANKAPVVKDYYVQYGGTGDGRTQVDPAANVASAIKSVNEDLFAGDVANIKILPSSNRDKNIGSTYEKGGKLEHGYTAWSDEGTIPQHSAKIIVQAIDSSVTTYLAFSKYVGYNATLTMNGPTEFKNITLLSTRTIYRNISHNGNSVTYGAGTKYACMPHDASTGTGTWAGTIQSKTAYSTYFGVSSTATYDDDVEIVYENEFASSGSKNDSIFLSGSSWGNNTYRGDMKLVVNNEKASLNIYLNDTTTIEGDLTIDVKKAVALTFTEDTGALSVGGNIQVLIPYSAAFDGNLNTMETSTVTAGKGIYILNVVSNVENALTLTDVPGTYTVASGYKAIARNVLTGEETAPSEGTLVVEPNAMYEVSLVDSYYNNGETITVYKTSTIDVANEKHNDKEGKVFIGWKKNGSFVAQSATYNAGDVLTAEYVDFTESDFVIEETQLRTENTAIRYIFKQNKAAVNSLPNVSEYGAIYLPTDVSKGAELRVDEPTTIVWAWSTADGADKNDMYTGTAGETPIKVSTPNILMESTTEKRYSVCLTGDNLSSNYATFYTVRGYIKFVDGNGLDNTIYCREETSSANKVAKEDDNKTAVHNTIIDTVKAEYAAFAAKFTYTEDKYYGQSNSGHESTFIEFKRNTNTSDSFGTLSDGSVSYDNRIVTINTGYDIEDIDIGWLTDLHLSYVNRTDVEKQNILALSSYRGRTFYRGAINRTMETLNNMMKRYSTTVITGDIVDYHSDGILMSVRNLVAKKSINNGINNNILMTTGNHEFADSCQPDIEGLVSTMTVDDMYKGLYSAWAHDVKYHEEILYKTNGDPNVMLISMDNGQLKMADGIAPYFEASMNKAKQLGIPMFIFCHVPLNTYNDTETQVWFNKNDYNGFGTEANNDGSSNFRDNGGYCHDKWDDNTAAIINLIRKNPDVVKGIFNGHEHKHMYSEIVALNEDGTVKEGVYIPQFTSTTINYRNQLNQISIR